MNDITSVGVFGANGRMGRSLIEAMSTDDKTILGCGLVRAGSPLLGIDAGAMIGQMPTGITLTAESAATVAVDVDVFIDFTLPEALTDHIQWCRAHGKAMVIGTTGLNPEQLALLDEASQDIAIVFAPNMSVGVNLMINLLKTCADVIGGHSDIEIIEAHHRFKKDAPSGTAMKFGEVIAERLGRDLSLCAVYGRQGIEAERDRQTIGFSTLRAADIVGEHTVMFADIGERLEITHKATSRLTFAKGALRAAAWLKNKPAGIYDMQTVLGLN